MKRSILITILICLIPVLSIAALIRQKLESIVRLTYAEAEFQETTAYLDNPYRGFYHIYGYVLDDETSYASIEDVPHIPSPENDSRGERLVQLQINLRNYADAPISAPALEQLDRILDAWSRTGYSVILRILYDWNGNAMEAEPDRIEQIACHMEQTAAVYNRYADTIYIIHGLSTGNTGEMHHTNYGSPEDMQFLCTKLADAAAPSIYLSVRTPGQWRSITGADSHQKLSASPENPFSGRLGLFNDGMLGSVSDTGTYTDRTRKEELAFQNELCRTVPNGGEAIIDNPYSDLENAVGDLRTMHVSYLNSVHDPAVIDKWKNSVYRGGDVYDGVSGYDYIRDHLGYRYVIRSSRLAKSSAGRGLALALSIENVGFSASYRRFSFLLTMVSRETGEYFTLIPECDSSLLPGSETAVLEIPIDGSSYPSGVYELYWQTVDESSGEVIRYGNDMELTGYGYRLGSLTVNRPYQRSEK